MSVNIATCPNCGGPVTTDSVDQPLRLYIVMAVLLVHQATIDMLMGLPEYEHARAGWDEKTEALTGALNQSALEMSVFGEHFDADGDGPAG